MKLINRNSENQSIDLLLLKKEVDALQIAIHSQKTPWYKNIPTILSVVALVLSFVTTYLSNKRVESQDIQNTRAELRILLQRLASLPREDIEITIKYEKENSDQAEAIRSLNNQERSLLANQAAEVIKKLPPEYISAAEYLGTGAALEFDFNVDGAKEHYEKAINISTKPGQRIAALCALANLLFYTGQSDLGRIYYQKALNSFSDFPKNDYNEDLKNSTHIWSELRWAYSEAGIGSFDRALERIRIAEDYLSWLTVGTRKTQLDSQIHKAKRDFEAAQKSNNSLQSDIAIEMNQLVIPTKSH